MSTLPQCPNFLKHRCERSAIHLIGEGDDHVTLHCETCKLTWVRTKAIADARAKFRNAEERLRKEAERRRAREQRPLYHDLGRRAS